MNSYCVTCADLFRKEEQCFHGSCLVVTVSCPVKVTTVDAYHDLTHLLDVLTTRPDEWTPWHRAVAEYYQNRRATWESS